jgi:hypothetical protein
LGSTSNGASRKVEPFVALGEQAALEVLARFLTGDREAEALLLFEDIDIA